jgi:hypothetical protein
MRGRDEYLFSWDARLFSGLTFDPVAQRSWDHARIGNCDHYFGSTIENDQASHMKPVSYLVTMPLDKTAVNNDGQFPGCDVGNRSACLQLSDCTIGMKKCIGNQNRDHQQNRTTPSHQI